jgi:4-amino-4-deoxy-L-arabinose transferase-like glycosyltransferase
LQPSTLAKRGWILLFLLIAVFYLYGLGTLPLAGPDEPRYAEVAREMLSRRDLITPTLGGQPWFEKPPLLYWMMMASYRVFGVSEYVTRLGPAICALLTGLGVFWVGRRVASSEALPEASTGESAEARSDFACWSALVFLSSAGAIVFSRAATFDIVITMTITAALAGFFVWHVADDYPGTAVRRNLPLLGLYFFVGVSLLAKGLVGIVIPFGVIVFYFVMRREWPSRRFLGSLFWGIPLLVVVAGVWYAPMISRHGWKFIDAFFVQHHFARFATNKYHHPGPFYFYLYVLPLFALPWTMFLVSALIGARRWRWRGNTPRDRLRVFALAWIVVPVTFFSLSGSKLPAYILPVLPAVAWLSSDRITNFFRSKKHDTAMRVTGATAIALGLGGAFYAARITAVPLSCISLVATPAVVVGTLALVSPQLRRALVLLVALATISAAAIALKCGAPIVARRYTVRDLLATAAARGYGSAPVVQLHDIERSAEFYAAGRLTYGPDGEPVKFDGRSQVIDAARRNGGPLLVLVPTRYEWQLTQWPAGLQTELIGDNGYLSVVVARVPDSRP